MRKLIWVMGEKIDKQMERKKKKEEGKCSGETIPTTKKMENIKGTLINYISKCKSLTDIFNKVSSLPDYFEPMIDNKKEIKIAELGAGIICTIGNKWKDVKIEIHASDIYQPEYVAELAKNNIKTIVPLEYQDMEHLTYPDEFFDIVHCVNALDHTADPKLALKEMFRVCKKGGWIYLRHYLKQIKHGGMHRWGINMHEGKCIFYNYNNENFYLSDIMDFKTVLDKGQIVSILHKDL